MKNKIDSSAHISKDVELGNNNIVDRNVILRGNILIGDNNYIGPNSVLINSIYIGNNNYIAGQISIGNPAQVSKIISLPHGIIRIGNDNVFREFIIINLPLINVETIIGNNNYFMGGTHVPHDAMIEDNIIMAHNSLIAGECKVERFANIGLNAHVHQKITIGEGAMIGINAAVLNDVPPFATVVGVPTKFIKINAEGLKRRGYTHKDVEILEQYYNGIPSNRNNLIEVVREFRVQYPNCLKLEKIDEF